MTENDVYIHAAFFVLAGAVIIYGVATFILCHWMLSRHGCKRRMLPDA